MSRGEGAELIARKDQIMLRKWLQSMPAKMHSVGMPQERTLPMSDTARTDTAEIGADWEDKLLPMPGSDEEWKARLTPEEYRVLRRAGTEPAFTGEYVDTDEEGMYRCRACGNPLFQSEMKYHSGCGWPSFTEAISPDAVELLDDNTYGMRRTEVRCSRCHSHLGHVFPDGPRDRGGKRYCMNSVSLNLEER